MENEEIIIILAIVIILAFSGRLSGIAGENNNSDAGLVNYEPEITNACELSDVTYGRSTVKVPAIDEDGNGVVTLVMVESMGGTGRTLVDIDQLLFWTDTQYSIQVSKFVAGHYTNYDLSNVDLIYAIDTEAGAIEGPSAGAALTIATISALYNESIRKDVMITGTIGPDGSIGKVGGVLEKATAAKEMGATVFLVPEGQATAEIEKSGETCEKIGPLNYCTDEPMPMIINISDYLGIDVIEVSTIEDAVPYFMEV